MGKQSIQKKVSEGLKMRGALIMSVLALSLMLTCTCTNSQEIRIIQVDNTENEQDEPQFAEFSSND